MKQYRKETKDFRTVALVTGQPLYICIDLLHTRQIFAHIKGFSALRLIQRLDESRQHLM